MTVVGDEIADGLSLVSVVLAGDQQAYNQLMRDVLVDVNRVTRLPLELSWVILGMVRDLARRDCMEPEVWWTRFCLGMSMEFDD